MTTSADLTEETLVGYVAAQRWYGSKGREVAHAAVVDCAELPGAMIALVEVRFPEGTHDTYQVVAGDRLDGLAEPRVARELIQRIRSGTSQLTRDGGTIFFQVVEGFTGVAAELAAVRVIESEQTNSSVVFDEELIFKVYRRLEAGINPELEMLRFLTERRFEHIAPLLGWYEVEGPLSTTLGVAQELVVDGRDGWELALEMLRWDAGGLLAHLHSLGAVVASLHEVLASDADDPDFGRVDGGVDASAVLAEAIGDAAAVILPGLADVPGCEDLADRAPDVASLAAWLAADLDAGPLIRHHGDLHLGQTLWTPDRWVLLDFEGEPIRPVDERRERRPALRDVAGLLRSLAYAVATIERTGTPVAPGWEPAARAALLDGYLASADPTTIPDAAPDVRRLLALHELEKVVYEIAYEVAHRPTWVPIPAGALRRTIDQREGAAA